jgi:uncharacterized protein (TIGR02466 family)
MSDFNTFDIFPVTLYQTNIPKNDVWEHRVIHNDWQRMGSDDCSITVSRNLFEYEEHNTKDELNTLKNLILNHVHKFAYEHYQISRETKFKISSSWGVKLEPGEFVSRYHYHSNSFLSAVYYFNRIENCGGIQFERNPHLNPVVIPGFEFDYETENNYNAGVVNFEPNTGDLIIFPSHLHHKVLPNLSKRDRYSLACNIQPVGTIGPRDLAERHIHFGK